MSSDNVQDAFIQSTFERIKNKKNIDELLQDMPQLCLEFKTNIIESEKYEFTVNITSHLLTSMLLPFFIRYETYTIDNYPYSKIDILQKLHGDNMFLGSIIKTCDLTSLTPYPKKSLELLTSCVDDLYYCVMSPQYLIIDHEQVEYYCNDDSKIKRITKKENLSTVENRLYQYCILPDGTLCLFNGHHSAGACGQPVICAGDIKITDYKITQIDNSSGHYSPPSSMLTHAINLLKTMGLIESDGTKNERLSGGEINVFVFQDLIDEKSLTNIVVDIKGLGRKKKWSIKKKTKRIKRKTRRKY